MLEIHVVGTITGIRLEAVWFMSELDSAVNEFLSRDVLTEMKR